MPTSGPGRCNSIPAAGGFTLIELLVVMAVLSVLAVGVTLSVTGRAPGAATDAARFRQSVAQQRAMAVAGRAMRGLQITPTGARLARVGPDGRWAVADTELAWAGRTSFQPLDPRRHARAADAGAPAIVFLPDGRITGFTIRFWSDRSRIACRTDGWEALACAPE